MAPASQRLPLTCLLVACLAAGIVRSAEVTTVDVMENDWYTFKCDYSSASDKTGKNELGVSVQPCSETTAMVHDPLKFKLVAAVFGRLTATSDKMKSKYMNNKSDPVYYGNTENAYVKDGLVEILDGNLNSISVRIKATSRTDRICVNCAQSADAFGYTDMKKESLKIRKPPTVSIAVNDSPVDTARQEMQINQTAKIVCSAAGPDTITITLFRNARVVASISDKSLTHEIARMTRDNAGVYKCEASTDLKFLVDRNSQSGSAEFVLAVKFAPQFELSEIVRYTQLHSQENIKITVPAYPAAALECTPTQPNDLTKQESYDDREFVTRYQLTLSNLNSVKNETEFECTAKNEVGERKLRILLTAKAPTPEILSNEKTTWHNSYQLRWQHNQNATIDFYQVEIAYKSGDGEVVNKTETKFDPKAQKGRMALVDRERQSGNIVHSGVLFGLNPDSQHDIRLKSCNKHGCSEFSDPVSVRTPEKSTSNFNDPENPEKAAVGGPNSVCLSARIDFAPLVASIFGAYLVAKQQHQL